MPTPSPEDDWIDAHLDRNDPTLRRNWRQRARGGTLTEILGAAPQFKGKVVGCRLDAELHRRYIRAVREANVEQTTLLRGLITAWVTEQEARRDRRR